MSTAKTGNKAFRPKRVECPALADKVERIWGVVEKNGIVMASELGNLRKDVARAQEDAEVAVDQWHYMNNRLERLEALVEELLVNAGKPWWMRLLGR